MSRLPVFFLIAFLFPELVACGREPVAADTDASRQDTIAPKVDSRPPEGGWKVGTHYELVERELRVNTRPGKVQVVEFFWYACVHCYELEPYIVSWNRTKPDYIEFVRVPSQGRPVSKAHARLYYTLEVLGREELHAEVFDAIHRHGNKLFVDDKEETLRLQLEFAKAHGIPADSFVNTYRSAAVNSALERADQLARRYKVIGVPTMVVNGKYLTSLGRAESPDNLIALVHDLAARESTHQ